MSKGIDFRGYWKSIKSKGKIKMSNYGMIMSMGKEIFEFGAGKNLRKFIRYTENGKHWTRVLDNEGNEILKYSKKVTRQNVGDKYVCTKTTERVHPHNETVEQARVYDKDRNLLGGRTITKIGDIKAESFKWLKGKWSSETAFLPNGKRYLKSFGSGSQNSHVNAEFLSYNAHGLPIPNLLVDTKGGVSNVNAALEKLQESKRALAAAKKENVWNETRQQYIKQLQEIQDPNASAKAIGVLNRLADELSYAKAKPLFDEANAFNPYSMKNVRNLYSQVREDLLLKQPIADVVEKHGKEILSGKMFTERQHLNS